jgi:hypothetical protein
MNKFKAALVVKKANGHLVQYRAMCDAITACHDMDECKDIINKSHAMAAYYAQIKDTETEVMFYRVRLRAWRRIAELCREALPDIENIETQVAKVKAIRSVFAGDPTINGITDHRIYDIIKLMALSASDFEYAVQQNVGGSVADLLRRTPSAEEQAEAWAERRRKEAAARARKEEKEAEKLAREREANWEKDRLKAKNEKELDQASRDALNALNITLEKKDRTRMKQVVFIAPENIYAVMEKASLDKRISLQEMMRRSLKLWMEANGYDWPGESKHQGEFFVGGVPR